MSKSKKKYIPLRKAFRQYIESIYEGIPMHSIYLSAKNKEFKTIRASAGPKARYLVLPEVLIAFVDKMQKR